MQAYVSYLKRFPDAPQAEEVRARCDELVAQPFPVWPLGYDRLRRRIRGKARMRSAIIVGQMFALYRFDRRGPSKLTPTSAAAVASDARAHLLGVGR